MEENIKEQEQNALPAAKNARESMRIQKTEYIRQQMRKRQEAEDALLVQLLKEQQVIDSLQEEIQENLEQTKESSRYNQEFKESMNSQIYALHGISGDKLEGMKEYKNAYYRGCAFSLFLLSVALIVLCGVLHGFQSEICIFMLSYTGMEGALLAQEKKRIKAVDWICKLLYLLMFPVMMVMFVCYELKYPEYGLFLPYVVIVGIGILVFALAFYFMYNPYRNDRKKVHHAKEHIKDIEKIARKEVSKNQKKQRKEEKKQNRLLKKEEKRQGAKIGHRFSVKDFCQKIKDKLHRKKEKDITEEE